MLAILLGMICVHLLIYQLIKQRLGVTYFTELIWGTFNIGSVIKIALCVSYFTKWRSVKLGN